MALQRSKDADLVTKQPFLDPPPSSSPRTPSIMQNEESPPLEDDDDCEQFYPGDPRDTQCGLGAWRPDFLQPCASMRFFTAMLSFINVFGNMNYSYYTAVITQIERRFGLSSSMTGFIKNVDNIGYMACVLFVSHFCRYANKPRLFACATTVTAMAIFLFAVPHFIYGSGVSDTYFPSNGTVSAKNSSKFEFCDGQDESGDTCGSNSNTPLKVFNTGALVIFIVSEIVQGMAQSPKFSLSITYMDDNSKRNSPKHLG